MEAPQDLTGTMVGRFAIRARLGSGGMGEVYRADDTKLKRSVALKRIASRVRTDERYRQRFLKEAERASRLTDQHIAQIYDVFEANTEIFLVMEYVEGQTLRQCLGRPLGVDRFLEIAAQCAKALDAAHQRNIVHCDIKPENIMLTPVGQVKILDFGVARELPRAGAGASTVTLATEADVLRGTVAYMAPEVLMGKGADGRADIFSLGVVFYEALTGRHPFLAETFVATSDRVLHQAPAPLRELNPSLPVKLDRTVTKMLAKDPAERYPTAGELLIDLLDARRVSGEPRLSAGTGQRGGLLRRARATLIAAATFVAVMTVVTLVYQHCQSAVFAERQWMLVADFDNQSGEGLLDRTVSELLQEALQQSRYLNVVPRFQVLEAARRMGRTEPTRVDAILAREICQRENYRVLLTGQIAADGSSYRITARVVDPRRGVPVVTETEPLQSLGDLYAGVDRLAQRLRRHLGESLSQIEKGTAPLARVTTPSLAALQRYSQAVDLYAAGDLERFLPLAKSAVDLDPDFAMAHLYLAKAYERLGNLKSELEHLTRAREGLNHVTERERYLILGMNFFAQGLYEKAAENYRLLTELYPDDSEGHRGLAEASVYAGHAEEAIQEEQDALRLNPHSALDYQKLMHDLNRVNRFREALAVHDEARLRGVDSPQFHWAAGLAHMGEGDLQAARREFELLAQVGGTYENNLAQLYSARLLIYEGRMREAAEALRAGLILDEKLRSETWVPVRRYLLARVELVRGHLQAARVEARRLALAVREDPQPENSNNLRRAGLLALELGDMGTAQRLLSLLDELRTSHDSAYMKSCYHNLKGASELVRGEIDAAIESQHRASVFFPTSAPYASLCQAYWLREDWRASIEACQRFLQFKGEIFRNDFSGDWVLAHLRLARAFVQAGDTQQSLRFYDEFLRLWAHADSDLPALQQAQAERKKFTAELRLNSSRPESGPKVGEAK